MSFSSTASPQAIPGLPENFTPVLFQGFDGLNNRENRSSIEDTELAVCHNLFPFGKNKLKTLPNVGATIYNSPGRVMALTAYGSGGTDGVFTLGITGGGGAGATGTFTVVAGKVKSFTITAAGAGYGSNPTISFVASAGLTGVTVSFTGVGNLAVSVLSFHIFNIGTGNIYSVLFLADGSATFLKFTGTVLWSVLFSTSIGTFAVADTGGGFPQSIQWGNQYLLIIAANGYWVFDGTLLYAAGSISPIITITNVGTGYGSNPVVTVGGGTGAGATFAVTRSGGQVINITPTAVGSGYVLADGIGSLTTILRTNPGAGGANGTFALAFTGTGTGAAGTFIVAGGIVTNIFLTNGGVNYTAAPTISFAASAGLVGAAATVTISIAPATLPLVFTGGGGTGAAGYISLMPFGVVGSALESYATRLWIINTNKIIYSAPGSFIDFSEVNGGGVITSTDSFLTVSYTNLFQSNGFLYYIADSSVGYISGVNTSGSPLITTFSNVNVDPQIGSFWRDSMLTFSKYILLGNNYGIHSIIGGSVVKISDKIDGAFQQPIANYTLNFSPSASQMVIFGQHCTALLLPQLVDPITFIPTTDVAAGRVINVLQCWTGKKWFTATQAYNLTYVSTFEFDSIISTYATDGMKIFTIFTNENASIQQTALSKLWDTPSYLITKKANRLLGRIQSPNAAAPAITVNVDQQNTSNSYNLATNIDPEYLTSGQKRFRINVEQTGYLLGLTILSTEANLTFQSFLLATQQYSTDI